MYVWQERRERQGSETNIMSNDRIINTSFWAKTVLSKQNSKNNTHFPFELRGQIYLVTFDLRRNNILVSAHLHGARRLVPQDCTHEQSAQTHTCRESQNIRIFAQLLIQNKTSTLFLSSSLTRRIMSDSEDFSEDEGGKQKFQPTLRYLSFDGDQTFLNKAL